MTTKRIYLAGKIAKNGWRHDLVPGLRDAYGIDEWTGYWGGGRDNPTAMPETWPELQMPNGLVYVGPFFVSDDHGCFHGDGRHGLNDYGCGEAYRMRGDGCDTDDHLTGCQIIAYAGHGSCTCSRVFAADQSLKAIAKATHVIAISTNDAHGTLVEIGYAVALRKEVFLTENADHNKGWTNNDKRDAWFPFTMPGTSEVCCVKCQLDLLGEQAVADKEEALCESPVELAFLREMRRDAFFDRFVPNVPVMGGRYRIDFADPHALVGVEIDGHAYHSDKDTFVRDRQRQRDLEQIGWRLVRFAGAEVHHDAADAVRQFRDWVKATTT